jgi:hypothetical protein
MEAKFTKGEWSIQGETLWCNNLPVCVLGDSWVTFSNAENNAHLIAAAPEMYAMLESLADCDENQMYRKEINELLAKARGESCQK